LTSIAIEGVSRAFGSVRAVREVSLLIGDGEFFTLLGPSGCGKTTLLRMIAGFAELDAGSISFGERRIDRLPPHRRNTGMVFQNYAIFPNLDVAGNVAYGLKARRVAGAEIARRVEEALKLVHLEGMDGRWPHQLSGGQLQRVAIGRALILSPRLLVADEAVSKLDVSVRAQILNLLKDVRQANGLSILFVTHDLHVARYLCDRIGVMYFGKLVEIGRTEDVLVSPRHPYTQALVDTLKEDDAAIPDGETAMAPPSTTGCRYASRCAHAIARCVEAHPELVEIADGHATACWRWRELAPVEPNFDLAHER